MHTYQMCYMQNLNLEWKIQFQCFTNSKCIFCRVACVLKSLVFTALFASCWFSLFLLLHGRQRHGQLLLCCYKECDESEDDMQQLLTLLDERVIPALDAVSIALSIMTADEMPKEVFVEDAIEWAVKLVKWHLFAIVYPHCSLFKGLPSWYFFIILIAFHCSVSKVLLMILKRILTGLNNFCTGLTGICEVNRVSFCNALAVMAVLQTFLWLSFLLFMC